MTTYETIKIGEEYMHVPYYNFILLFVRGLFFVLFDTSLRFRSPEAAIHILAMGEGCFAAW